MANPTALPEELGGDALGSADPPQVNPNGGVTTETIQSIKLAYGGPYSNFSPDGYKRIVIMWHLDFISTHLHLKTVNK